ncbi:hypothetical protein ONS95_011943 [Cadophora gregata]|uniref:uncharacterized protein n=1 Tax=Cadophora gregata TaxID=51156 RepID=UPI0026DD6E3A|nr:uncharacterized protein ONS95_011943 [Cadophora gregata]KAK0117608.1 hypothetical protein ONS95_011943 [Cadophora gregata]
MVFSNLRSIALLATASHTLVNAAKFDLPIIFDNSYASVVVDIGTPAETYRLHFDTGSASTWVANERCSIACSNGSGYTRVGYNASESSTSLTQGPYESIEYAGGYVEGDASTDTFAISSSNSTLTWQQTFLAVYESSWRFISADGFLGLAFSEIAATNTTTFFETLMQKGLVDLPRFGIYYGKEFLNTGDVVEGELTLGGSKEDVYVNRSMTYIPLRQEVVYQVWRTEFKSVSVSTKNTTIKSLPGSGSAAVFDTGAGSMAIPPEMIDDVYNSIGWNFTAIMEGQYIPRCSEFTDAWSVTFDFGNWDSADGQYAVTLTGDQLARPGFAGSNDNCYPPFESSDSFGFALLGTPLLHHFYTVSDFGAMEVENYQPRIGFGQLKEEYKP